MTTLTCPACGSSDIQTNTESELIEEQFGGTMEIGIKIHTCKNCGTSGDFLNENEKVIQKSIDLLKDKAVQRILEDFSSMRYNFASIERALEIPQRTFSRWKSKTTSPSAPSIALLKFLKLFPWLIEVAEQGYDYSKAQKIHMADSFSQFINQISFDNQSQMPDTTTTFEFVRVQFSNSPEPEDNDPMDYGFTLAEIEAKVISQGSI